MGKKEHDFYYIEDHLFQDKDLHEPILAEGDFEAAKKVSDAVARKLGLTEAEIAALSQPPKNYKGKPK